MIATSLQVPNTYITWYWSIDNVQIFCKNDRRLLQSLIGNVIIQITIRHMCCHVIDTCGVCAPEAYAGDTIDDTFVIAWCSNNIKSAGAGCYPNTKLRLPVLTGW